MVKRSNIVVSVSCAMCALILMVAAFASDQSQDKHTLAMMERGRYLVTLGGCGDCHTPKKMTDHGPMEDSTLLLSGHPAGEKITSMPKNMGNDGWIASCNAHLTAWAGPWGVSFSANLTSDPNTGIGTWKDEQFIQAMRTGKHRGFGRQILPPMPWQNLAQATDEDLKAILAFLKSTKPIINEVPPPIKPGL